jgi:hypothetical protein
MLLPKPAVPIEAQGARRERAPPGCYASFYRSRCLVCEERLRRKNEHQKFGSGHATCAGEFRRFPHVYEYKPTKPSRCTSFAGMGGGNPDKIRLETAPQKRSTWRQIAGPALSARSFALAILPIDAATADRIAYTNAKAWGDAAIVGPKHPPINLLGGYRFPSAPRLDPTLRLRILGLELAVWIPITDIPQIPTVSAEAAE